MATPEARAREARAEAQANAQAARDVAIGTAAATATQARTTAATAAAERSTAQQVAQAVSAVMLAFVRFLAALAVSSDGFVRSMLRRRTANADLIELLVREEHERGREFDRKAAERLQRDLPLVMSIPNAEMRAAALRGVMDRERRYASMRVEAQAARAVATVDRIELKRDSPQGAFWLLDPNVKEHTAGCLVMGMKFWPWSVLDRVHPPRHPACPCRLIGYGNAISMGLMRPGEIPDEAAAVRQAAAVIMEAEQISEDDCPYCAPDEKCALHVGTVTEAFDPNQPRDPLGRWVHVLARELKKGDVIAGDTRFKGAKDQRVIHVARARNGDVQLELDRHMGPRPILKPDAKVRILPRRLEWKRGRTGSGLESTDGRYRISSYTRGGGGFSPRQRGALLRHRPSPDAAEVKLGEFENMDRAKAVAEEHALRERSPAVRAAYERWQNYEAEIGAKEATPGSDAGLHKMYEKARRLRAEYEAAKRDQMQEDEQLVEGFNLHQPRWPKGHPQAGQWRPSLHVGSGRRSRSWLDRDIAGLRERIDAHVAYGRTEDIQALGADVQKVAERFSSVPAYEARLEKNREQKREILHQMQSVEPETPEDAKLVAKLDPLMEESVKLSHDIDRARQDAYAGMLEELRGVGGRLRVSRVRNMLPTDVHQQIRDEHGQPPERLLGDHLLRIGRFMPREWIDDINRRGGVEFHLVSGVRAEHRQLWEGEGDGDSLIRVDPREPSTVLHELAHRIEGQYGDVRRNGYRLLHEKTYAFLRERTRGENTSRLRDLTGNPSYRPDEIAKPDDFRDPYVGKVYREGQTEILTMGLEALYYPAYGRDFAEEDRGHRDLMLGLLAGV